MVYCAFLYEIFSTLLVHPVFFPRDLLWLIFNQILIGYIGNVTNYLVTFRLYSSVIS